MEYDQKNINELNQSLKKTEYSTSDKIKRWIPSIIILPLAIIWIVNRGEYGLLDNIDLVIHEAGHFFFSFFGKFIYTLGGTLMQVILPSVIVFLSSGTITEPEFSSGCSGLDRILLI